MAPPTPTTIVLARFDDLLAGGLRDLIERDPSLAILSAGVEHARIPVVLRAHHPDVAILELDSLERPAQVRELREAFPRTRLVLLSDAPSNAECTQLLAFGASACLASSTQARDLIHAIHLAARGIQVMPHAAPGLPRQLPSGQLLTQREAEVLPLLRAGRSNSQIGLELGVGVETVKTHARNVYRKLGVSSRRELSAAPEPAPRGPESPPARDLGLERGAGARRPGELARSVHRRPSPHRR
jgi:DNA-binding NarL/FixJ family response regulator